MKKKTVGTKQAENETETIMKSPFLLEGIKKARGQKVFLSHEEVFKDPYVEELHKIREGYAKKFDFDVDAMFKDLKEKEQLHKDRLVSSTKRK